jgi:hypothetical protein
LANVSTADPPRLPLPDHVHRLIPFNRSPGRFEHTLKAKRSVKPGFK